MRNAGTIPGVVLSGLAYPVGVGARQRRQANGTTYTDSAPSVVGGRGPRA
jgi:hypothetical protein